jgi:pimeloyl-ACP methyl ester carboxylesterase
MPHVRAAGRSLAYEWVRRRNRRRATLVFLHEGLGSIRQWRGFPDRVAAATGCAALVYDRYGYGQSEVLREPRRTAQFMHEEALVSLPKMLEKLGIDDPLLVGHSDGASIALIYAGAGRRSRGVVTMAPHVFIEPKCLHAIAQARERFEQTDLATRLARRHRDARRTFYGWADVWLDPAFTAWDIRADYLPGIRVPVLAIQGYEDEYATMQQLDEIGKRARAFTRLVRLAGCGHAPFRDQPGRTLLEVSRFIQQVLH